jgi:Uma2 family endonuclease
MASTKPRILLRLEYERAAEEYLRNLPPEHFMEGRGQAIQRKITLESMDLVNAERPEVQTFNELLVQYALGEETIGQVVPDNMVIKWKEPIQFEGSFNVPLQPVGPFWVLEYVSNHNKRKDYETSFQKYEQHLKVPYYLLFYPDGQELTLFHHDGTRYVTVPPNENGRHPIPELELELGLLDGWVRYWFRGKLLPLPGDLLRELDKVRQELQEARQLAEELERRAEELERRATDEARRAAEAEKREAEAEKRAADEGRRAAEAEKRAAEAEKQASSAARQVEGFEQRMSEFERAQREMEQELALLRAQMQPPPTAPTEPE